MDLENIKSIPLIVEAEPPMITTVTPHLKWINGELYQLWDLRNCYRISTEWRKVPAENVN